MKAWDARASFEIGTNMKAWTFMIPAWQSVLFREAPPVVADQAQL